jgi:tetratricopeptide (TPR) repeat protein
MSSHHLSSEAFFPDLSSEAWKQLIEIIERFENAWQAGGCPVVEDYLAFTGPQRRALLVELIHVDLHQRAARGTPARLEAYLARHAELQEDSRVLVDLLRAEYALRRASEPDLGPEEYLRRFPRHAAALAACFQPPAGAADPTGPTVSPLTLPFSALPPPGSSDPTGDPHESRTLPPGQGSVGVPRVPGYEILGELGRGGMGVVFKARHLALDRVVALKISLAGDLAGPGDRERLLAEARSVARLQHPNIVQIHEVGEHNGQPFFSLEFCPGGSLEKKLGGSPVLPAEAAVVVETLARAMQVAHEARLVHRDLKPANVLLGADGTLKITDFGLAKRLDEAGRTHHGAIQGTPSYMAPEQAIGASEEIGPASDVYALTAILYQLLTGRPPFRGASAWDTLAMVCQQEPVPPGRLQAKIPFDLETICLKGLHKQPGRRYASALDLACDLRRFLNEEPIHARRTALWEQAWKWAHRKPAAAALVVAILLIVLTSMTGAVLYGLYAGQQARALQQQAERRQNIYRLRDQGRLAEAAAQLARDKGNHDEAARQFGLAAQHLDGALAALDVDPDGSDTELRDLIAEWRDQVGKHLAEQAERQRIGEQVRAFWKDHDEVMFSAVSPTVQDQAGNDARVRLVAAQALARFGVTAEQAPADAGRALLARQALFESPRQVVEVVAACYEMLLVWAEAEAGKPNVPAVQRGGRAVRLLETADALGRAHGLEPSRDFFVRRMRCRSLAGDLAGAAADRVEVARRRLRTPQDHFLAALEAWKQGNAPQAAAACETALRLGPDHFWAQYLQGLCWMRPGSWSEARVAWTGCLARRPQHLWARLLRATAAGELGESAWPAAEADFHEVLERADDSLTRYVALINRTTLRLRQKRFDAALSDLDRAARLRDTPEIHASMALAHSGRKDWRAAVAALDQAIRRRPSAALYNARARAQVERANHQAARADLEKVIALEKASRSDLLVSALVELGYVKHKAGEHAAALADFDEAARLRPNAPLVHLQRAEALRALGRHAEAGAALDRYLVQGKRRPEVYFARGLIHAKLGDQAAAIDAFSAALQFGPDARTRSQRGWAYLSSNAAQLALADFEAALKLGPTTCRRLCGRALARVRLRQVDHAIKDVEAALRLDDARGPEALLLAACVYARAGTMATLTAPRSNSRVRPASRYEERAVDLLGRALQQVPEKERPAFWRVHVQSEEALDRVRDHVKVRHLARSFGQ